MRIPVQGPIMRISDLARYLRVDRSTVYRLIRSGKVPYFLLADNFRFHREEIEKWVNTQHEATADLRPLRKSK